MYLLSYIKALVNNLLATHESTKLKSQIYILSVGISTRINKEILNLWYIDICGIESY
jgi:hypothetical protein